MRAVRLPASGENIADRPTREHYIRSFPFFFLFLFFSTSSSPFPPLPSLLHLFSSTFSPLLSSSSSPSSLTDATCTGKSECRQRTRVTTASRSRKTWREFSGRLRSRRLLLEATTASASIVSHVPDSMWNSVPLAWKLICFYSTFRSIAGKKYMKLIRLNSNLT